MQFIRYLGYETASRFAKNTEISHSTAYNLAKGGKPNAKTRYILSEMGANIDWLIEGKGESPLTGKEESRVKDYEYPSIKEKPAMYGQRYPRDFMGSKSESDSFRTVMELVSKDLDKKQLIILQAFIQDILEREKSK